DHHKAERLGPVDGEQQRSGIAQKRLLLVIADLTDILDPRRGKQGPNDRIEVLAIHLVDLGGDAKRHAEPPRDLNRTIHALLRADAPEEGEVAPAPSADRPRRGASSR